MCCEICPRFTNCEEEGHLNEMCCVSCPEYHSCHDKKKAGGEEGDDAEDEFGEV